MMHVVAAVLIIVNIQGGSAQVLGFQDMETCKAAQSTISDRFGTRSAIRAQCVYGPAVLPERNTHD